MNVRHRRRSTTETEGSGGLGKVGIGLALVACCAVPPLLAGGALATLGGIVGDPVMILAGVGLVAGAIAWLLRRRT